MSGDTTYDLDIWPVLEYYGAEQKYETTSWRTLKCPFHEDKTASARTNGFGFMCHGCGVKGNALSLLMEGDNIDFPSAIDKYEELIGSSVPDLRKRSKGQRSRKVPFEERSYERGNNLFQTGIRGSKRRPFSGA